MSFRYDRFDWRMERAPLPKVFEKCPYGVPSYWGTFWHKRDDGVYDISFNGQAIFEVGPGKSTFMIIPDEPHGYAWKTRIATVLRHADIETSFQRKKRANGATEWTLKAFEAHKHTAFKIVTFQRRLQITDEYGKFVFEPAETKVDVNKDNEAYRAFNKELKRLKGVLLAQVKLGGYKWVAETGFRTVEKIKEFEGLLPVKVQDASEYAPNPYYAMRSLLSEDMAYDSIKAWTDGTDRSPEAVKRIMWGIMLHYYPNWRQESDPIPRQNRCVINALRKFQVRFLRENCVTISESKNTLGSSNDARQNEDSQLFPTDRLREVQVPCEAEVC